MHNSKACTACCICGLQVQKHNSSSGSSSINIGFAINTSSSSSDNATPLTHRDAAGAGCFNRRVGDRGTGIADPAADVSGDLCARVQSQAGLVLGYLCFDGEGTRSDRQEAVRYFKLSTAAGWGRESREAAQVLGWIWNTGKQVVCGEGRLLQPGTYSIHKSVAMSR